MREISEMLNADKPDQAARALERSAGPFLVRLDRVVGPAVQGRPPAVRDYVRSWRRLRERLLEATREAEPDLVGTDEQGRPVMLDEKGRPAPWLALAVDQAALQAPFSSWVPRFGRGRGVALHLLSELRRCLRRHDPLADEGEWDMDYQGVDERSFRRFQRLVFHELLMDDPLEMIAETFGLNDSELARLFGVTRQAVQQWLESEIPEARLGRIHSVQHIADLLGANLKPERIPAVVRTSAPAYDGRSLLEAIAAGDEAEALTEIRRTFDWAVTA